MTTQTHKKNNQNINQDDTKDQGTTHGKQGFASMSKEKVKEIASKGGKSHGHNHDHDEDDQDHQDTTSQKKDSNFAHKSKEELQELGHKGGKTHKSTTKK